MSFLGNQRGVSLVEVIVASLIIGILAAVVSEFYVQRLIDYARSNTLLILQSNTKQALESVQRDIRSARSISATNQWPDLNGPGGNQYGWNSSSGSPSVLVLAVPAKYPDGELIYADGTHDALETNDVIYYINGAQKTLYRRVIANPVDNNAALTTCPAAIATATCPADGKVIEDVANLTANYYDSGNVVTAIPSLAYSLEITLTQSRYNFGRTYTNSLKSRGTLRNKL